MVVDRRMARHAGRYFAVLVAQSKKYDRLFTGTEPRLGRILYFTCIRVRGGAMQFGCIGCVVGFIRRLRGVGAPFWLRNC
jgi:hypothetical protein